MSTNTNVKNNQNTGKRIIFVTGDKGGVGKSFVARALVQYFLDRKVQFRAYDLDPVNPNLAQFYPQQTTQLDIDEPGGLDIIRNDLDSHSLLIVDCAARAIGELDAWFIDMALLEQRKELRLSLTIAFVVTPDKSCTIIMRDALDRFGDQATYLVVRNLGKGSNFSIYEGSQLKKTLQASHGGHEISVPALLERTVVLLDSNDVSFGEAANSPMTTSADRSRVAGFLMRTYTQFDNVRSLLLPDPTVTERVEK
ncbi:hypothetical protein DB346_23105 [Verrucomicrobia bacterium LW23]|nr:hypothetical protein DB346_23105 [Verrucomicrobia bacterium LW23]